MPGSPVLLGPFTKGLHNSAGTGEFIDDAELFDIVNLEVDTDGSLANRPAIRGYPTSGLSGRTKVMGIFIPASDRQYLVVSDRDGTYLNLVQINTGVVISSAAISAGAVVQYKNNLYVCPKPSSGSTGGYFNNANPPVWTVAGGIPAADSAAIFNERMWAGAGINSTTDTSRLKFSAIGDFTSWNAADYFDINPGDGEKLTSIVVLNNDLVLFKEHSTWRAGYTSDVRKMQILNVSRTVGTPNARCAVMYDNNNIYLLHDNSVYELYNYTFTKLSSNIRMQPDADPDLYSDEIYGLTLFRNRLFVRYYKYLYVYSLLSGRWSRWDTNNKFSFLVTMPIASGEQAYAHSSTTALAGNIFTFTEDRVMGVQTQEAFECSITTKTYDFDVSHAYKVLFWWGLDIATLGVTNGKVTLANASRNPIWYDWNSAGLTWQDLFDNNVPWSTANSISFDADIYANVGGYGKKILKLPKKIRFRQLFFTVTTQALPNTTADAAVRIYTITAFVNKKETVVRETT